MKFRLVLITLTVALLGGIAAYAVAGGSSDPLISLSYLRGTYTDKVLEQAAEVLESADEDTAPSSGYTEKRLNGGDTVELMSGGTLLPLAGTLSYTSGGTVIDATAGTVLSKGAALAADHRYIAGGGGSAVFTVTGKTACIDYMGTASVTASAVRPDYTAMAEALKSLSLLRGSFTGYGSGFDLETAPTRGAALIMFIRMLGEEEEALSYSGSCPFTDLDKNGSVYPYVVYAYNKGYTTGYTKTEFRPSQTANIYQYTAFLLRAMGYSSETNISAILDKAYSVGVITASELASFKGSDFLRADLVYLSYYALKAYLPSGEMTLAEKLMGQGVFTYRSYTGACAGVNSARI